MSSEARKPLKVYVLRKAIGEHGPAFLPPDLLVIDPSEKKADAVALEFLCKCKRVDRERAAELFDIEFLA